MFGLGSSRRVETWTSWLGFKWWTAISMCLSWRDWGIAPSPISGKMSPPQKIQVKKMVCPLASHPPWRIYLPEKNVSRTCFLMYIDMTVCIFCFDVKFCMKLLVFPLIERWFKYLNLLFKILLDSIYYLSSFHWLVDWENMIFHFYLNCSCESSNRNGKSCFSNQLISEKMINICYLKEF